jgi:Family of unknown function (DUF6496)
MPWNDVMHKWGNGELHSGSPKGPMVKNQKQAVAIMLSEKKGAAEGKAEYKAKKPMAREGSRMGRPHGTHHMGQSRENSPFTGSPRGIREQGAIQRASGLGRMRMTMPEPDE